MHWFTYGVYAMEGFFLPGGCWGGKVVWVVLLVVGYTSTLDMYIECARGSYIVLFCILFVLFFAQNLC